MMDIPNSLAGQSGQYSLFWLGKLLVFSVSYQKTIISGLKAVHHA